MLDTLQIDTPVRPVRNALERGLRGKLAIQFQHKR